MPDVEVPVANRPYRIWKLATPRDVGERRPARYLLQLGSRFYPHPTIASARLWGDNTEHWED